MTIEEKLEKLKRILNDPHLTQSFIDELARQLDRSGAVKGVIDTAIYYTLRDSQTDKAIRDFKSDVVDILLDGHVQSKPLKRGEHLTSDRNDPDLHVVMPDGQNKKYLILSDDERKKGFVRPVRHAYIHVGLQPQYPLVDLGPDDYGAASDGYVKLEKYPEHSQEYKNGKSGTYWTQEQLDKKCCGAVTTMSEPLAETYARNPKFYGATYCSHCKKHFPVAEFKWDGTDETVGS